MRGKQQHPEMSELVNPMSGSLCDLMLNKHGQVLDLSLPSPCSSCVPLRDMGLNSSPKNGIFEVFSQVSELADHHEEKAFTEI